MSGIDHVAIAVHDIDQAISWYQSVLGFDLKVHKVTEGQDSSMVSAVMQSGTATIVLVQGLSPDSQVSKFINQFGPGMHHIAFSVSNLDTIVEVASREGALDTPVVGEHGSRQVFLRRDEVSGIRVELIESGNGSYSDTNMSLLYRSLEKNDLY